MKRIIILATFIAALASCGESEKPRTLADDARDGLIANLNDPDSFELVEEALIDSTSIRQNLKKCHIWVGEGTYYKRYQPEKYKEIVAKHAAMDSLEAVFEREGILDSIVAYTYLFKFRATNAFGAKILQDTMVQIEPSGKLINIASETEDLVIMPGRFPGYNEIFIK